MRIVLRNLALLGLASQAIGSVRAFQPGQTPQGAKLRPTSLPVAAPVQSGREVHTSSHNERGGAKYRKNRQKRSNGNRQPTKAQMDEKKEFTWLYWLYRQWHDRPAGDVEKSILQQFLPAAQSWKNKQSMLGARRAEELVERYCIEYLAGNDNAIVHISSSLENSSQGYSSKLLRAGLEAWLQCADEAEPIQKAQNLLDNLMVLADRAILDSNSDSETVARAKSLQTQVEEHRVFVEKRSFHNQNDNGSAAGQQLSHLLNQALSFMEGGTSRHLENSLVAMQQIVVGLDRMVDEGNSELIDDFERELVFSMHQQDQLLQTREWLSVALPFWEFLHHSLIRALVNVNEKERAERTLEQMRDILSKHPNMAGPNSQQVASMQRIVAMEDEGKDLIKMIKKNKQYQWLHWLSHQLSISAAGELSDSVLKLVMPAISMHAKRKTKKDAQQAEELLNRYVEEFKAGNPKATLTNNYFNSVCDAWAKLGDPCKAQGILNDMVQLRHDYPENKSLKTDVYSLSTLAAAWANKKSPEAAQRAEEILTRMEEESMDPTTITYNTVLRALIHSRGVDKAMRAEEIVQRMEERYEAGHRECRPTIRTYQSLISAWSRTELSGTAQKAEQVLDFLDSKSREKGFSHLAPNAHCFAAAIHGWAYSGEEQKARRAYNILSHMRGLYEEKGRKDCQPNVVVYTAVINACASPCLKSEKEEAFQIAQLAMDELCYNRSYGWPNFLTFAAFLRVCETTLEPGSARDNLVRSVFGKCCESGQVAEVVIEKLQRAASSELYRELVIDTGVEDEEGKMSLPRGWTRRVEGVQTRAKPTRKRRRTRPEYNRMHQVRLLKGTAGRYSKNKGETAFSISFDEGGF